MEKWIQRNVLQIDVKITQMVVLSRRCSGAIHEEVQVKLIGEAILRSKKVKYLGYGLLMS